MKDKSGNTKKNKRLLAERALVHPSPCPLSPDFCPLTSLISGRPALLGPIFNREFLTVPRRPRHYATRAAYLGALWVISVTAWLSALGWTRPSTLGETARFGPLLFQVLTFVQLALFLFFSALSAASAVSLEKDRRTFVLLLLTDLRDFEIVLGKVLGSLLPIGLLLLGSLPVLMSLLLLGGVAAHQVLQAALV